MSQTQTVTKMIDIYIMGKRYQVPEGLTIQKAMEYAGYKLIRGVGCRSGFCGACGTIYRVKDDPQLKYALACQTVVEDDMYLTQIPFFPAEKAIYDIAELEPTGETLLRLYPDLMKCMGCNSCTKSCPQEIEVISYIADALKGDIASLAEKSFDCVMCGLCAARCPAGLPQYNIGLLGRRLYGRYLAPRSQHLADRVAEVEGGKFDAESKALMEMPDEELRRRYNERDIER
ncbi:MAG: 4Fe-4S dicluster domain-containing protein [Chloroflexota bacterium]|nr:4Fe-4S dicluster domain-containing protein [Chloroflexota bacterium]